MIYCRTMLKPNHKHPQGSLKSVCAVGGCLSRYLVAGGVAVEAPSTCKQPTPQTTAICDGAGARPTCTQAAGQPGTCKQHRQWVAARGANGLGC